MLAAVLLLSTPQSNLGGTTSPTDIAPNEYPESSKTILKFAQNIMVSFEAVVPEDPVDSGLFTEVMLSGTVFKDLQTLNVFVPTRFSNDVVEVHPERHDEL